MQQPDVGFGEEEEVSGKVLVPDGNLIPPLPPEEEPQLSFDEISSPLDAELLDFCDSDLFTGETLTTSEVASCSNCCYDEHNSYSNDQHSFPQDISFSAQEGHEIVLATNNLSIICDLQTDIDNDISASINFSPCPQLPNASSYLTNTMLAYPPDGLDFSQIQVMDKSSCSVILDGLRDYTAHSINNGVISQCPPQFPPPVFEDYCSSSMYSFLRLNASNPTPPNCSWLDFSSRPLSNMSHTALSVVGSGEGRGIFGSSNLLMGSDQQNRELEFTGDNGGLFCPDPIQSSFNSNELQALCSDDPGQWMRPGGKNGNNLSTEISSLEEPNYRVGKLSVEQKKEKIHRYMKKRNERNFSKKIKYACRKTLADSRPRVRGRFAKNDEYGGHGNHRNYGHHEEEEDDDIHVKDEEDILDSDIFAHTSGVNSFKFNNPIQSWT